MTYRELITKIDGAYPDGQLGMYADDLDRIGGDGLAEFIAREISETFEADATDQEQIETALGVISTSTDEITSVRDRLAELAGGVTA